MEDERTPMHTMKVVVLDTTRRGRPLTLDELALAVGSRLGMVPRATQKVVVAPGFRGRPFWVDDPGFDLSRHLDERTLLAPGDRRELDALYAELASTILPRDRALWAMTLVHGLEGGRQAVVVRIHHAVVDGLGALNAFVATSTDAPGSVVPLAPPDVAGAVAPRRLVVAAARDTARTWRTIPALGREVAGARRRNAVAAHPDIPKVLQFGRTSLNAAGDVARSCASGSLDLATVRAIGKATGTTVNGVLHGVVAGAVRRELEARGEDPIETTGAFGIASDRSATERLHGNAVTPTFVRLRSDLADPLERLEATARSCTAAVEARRGAGLDLTDRITAHLPRALNAFRRAAAKRTTMNPGDVVTANVAGPAQRRWYGDIEVVDWISHSVAMDPASINVTVHSYDGRMNVSVVAVAAAMPDPAAFVARMEDELALLVDAVLVPEARATA
jgi:WS/DGAT/MGAT family acyltransferase